MIYYGSNSFHKYERNDIQSGRHVVCNVSTSFFQCAKILQDEKYDLTFILKRSFSSALLAFLTGTKYRIGFSTELRTALLTHSVKYNSCVHELDNFLNCLQPLGIKPQKYTPEIFPTKQEEERAQGFLVRLNPFKPKVLVHATSAHPYKRWPKRYFAKLIDYMFNEFGAQFVFTGASVDKPIYDSILNLCANKTKLKVLNICGLTNLRECFVVYKGLDLAVCVDSGNAHIAGCTGIPTYVLYGPTKYKHWLPIGKNVFPITLKQLLPCQPCDVKISCLHLSCMKLLTPESVYGNLQTKHLFSRNAINKQINPECRGSSAGRAED